MNRHTATLGSLLVLTASLGASGCLRFATPEGPSWRDPDSVVPAFRFDAATPLAQRVMLEGTMGSMTAVHGPTVQTTASAIASSSSNVRIDAEDVSQHWWVMTSVSFGRPLSAIAALPVGSEVGGGSVMGCSGPRHGSYTFDRTTSNVLVHVEQGAEANTRLLRIWAAWGGQSVEGALEVQVP